jgi:ribosomal protein S18 acetylase RimI-like enzyme
MAEVNVVNYQAGHQKYFESLNRSWIEKFFWMEPIDVAVLQNPDTHILEKGGQIFMAEYEGEVIGTVALKVVSENVFEFTKMAVDEKFQGIKVGEKLALTAIHYCQSKKAKAIILYSNTKLIPAINLYRKLGFIEVPLDGIYERSDIKMELTL